MLNNPKGHTEKKNIVLRGRSVTRQPHKTRGLPLILGLLPNPETRVTTVSRNLKKS